MIYNQKNEENKRHLSKVASDRLKMQRTDAEIESSISTMRGNGYKSFGSEEEDVEGVRDRLGQSIEDRHYPKHTYFVPTRERLILAFRKLIGILKKEIKEAEKSLPFLRAEIEWADNEDRRRGLKINRDYYRQEKYDQYEAAFKDNENNIVYISQLRERLLNVENGFNDLMLPPRSDCIVLNHSLGRGEW